MDIKSVTSIYFSPTGTTKKITEAIAKGMRVDKIQTIDCTIPAVRNADTFIMDSDLIILAIPVYYGRVPKEVVPFLKTLNAHQTPVVLAVVYGNREYDDALIELRDISIEQGLIPVAGGTFIAEHSYSTPTRPIAIDRPDSNDLTQAQTFGAEIIKKLKALPSVDDLDDIHIPGNKPYIAPTGLLRINEAKKTISFTPVTDRNKCKQCNLCIDVCPSSAIDSDDVTKIQKWDCLLCFACIKQCPTQAKQMIDPNFDMAIQQLQKICLERKEPELFL